MKHRLARWLRKRADRLDPPPKLQSWSYGGVNGTSLSDVTVIYTDPTGRTRWVGP